MIWRTVRVLAEQQYVPAVYIVENPDEKNGERRWTAISGEIAGQGHSPYDALFDLAVSLTVALNTKKEGAA